VGRIVNKKKNDLIKDLRGASFEEIVSEGVLLDVRINKNYQSQEFEIYFYQNYVWVIVVGKDPNRFITAYKSRKLKKEYGL
jgi:hypothetical protein